jgi:hypothetical protein
MTKPNTKDPEVGFETGELVDVDLQNIRGDPFAEREGKTLTWTNVNMTLAVEKGGEDRQLLKDVWGEVPATQTTAILGPRYVW